MERTETAAIILGDGDDVHGGTHQDDIVYGRKGNDRLDGLAGDAGDDTLDGWWGADTLVGDRGDDLLVGAWGEDRLFGRAGNDVLSGEWGRDHLDGGSGDDRLDGSYDADRLTGGAGADRFELAYAFLSAPGEVRRDAITDFRPNKGDRIDLSGMDANVERAGDQAFAWAGADARPGVGEVGFERAGEDVIVRGYIGRTFDDGQGWFEIELDRFHGTPKAGDFLL
jgi:Ca2+-binding RTX toxin-like protein